MKYKITEDDYTAKGKRSTIVEVEACCEPFAKAQTRRTDNEGYDALIRTKCEYVPQGNELKVIETEGCFVMGSDLPPINLCPWCGAAKGESDGNNT